MDTFSHTKRSEIMRKVKGRDTAPERRVRSLVFGLGYRYRKNVSGLPGSPDLAFAGRKKVLFVHGCFWHGHACRAGRNRPASNTGYWQKKLGRTMERDAADQANLADMGWSVLVIWECELRDLESLGRKIQTFLGPVGGRARLAAPPAKES